MILAALRRAAEAHKRRPCVARGRARATPLLERLRLILSALDAAGQIEDMDQVTFVLHPLKGDLKGFWSVKVQGNWRVIFRFADGKATDIDLVDYH
jgi:toxin HigB-1